MYELGDEHYADGQRYHSSDRFEGTVYPCGCGEPFVSEELRDAHITAMKAEGRARRWRLLRWFLGLASAQ